MSDEAKRLAAEKLALEKEANRLKGEPYKTMVPPLEQSTLDDLKGWKQPRYAYVLFESRQWSVKTEKWGRSTFTLNVDARPDQLEKIDYYLNKGFRVIDYGSFPKSNSEDSRVQARVALYRSGPESPNPWDTLKARLDREINKVDSTVIVKERDDIQAKYEKAMAENEALKAKAPKKVAEANVKG
jgi:hypothetical protein